MIRKIIIFVSCIALLVGSIVAQKKNCSYLSTNIYTGLSSLSYAVRHEINAKSKVGIGISAKCDYYFNRHWGIFTNESDFCFGVFTDYGFSDIKNDNGSLLSRSVNPYHLEASNLQAIYQTKG